MFNREDAKHEKIIRGLLKLPENKKCINCGASGPQYVCTSFGTFVCTTCSGIHREYAHRIKSVSMAKFTDEEVAQLQSSGNGPARDYFFKSYDANRYGMPSSKDVKRLRDFIREVYVDRLFVDGGAPPVASQSPSGAQLEVNGPPADLTPVKTASENGPASSSEQSNQVQGGSESPTSVAGGAGGGGYSPKHAQQGQSKFTKQKSGFFRRTFRRSKEKEKEKESFHGVPNPGEEQVQEQEQQDSKLQASQSQQQKEELAQKQPNVQQAQLQAKQWAQQQKQQQQQSQQQKEQQQQQQPTQQPAQHPNHHPHLQQQRQQPPGPPIPQSSHSPIPAGGVSPGMEPPKSSASPPVVMGMIGSGKSARSWIPKQQDPLRASAPAVGRDGYGPRGQAQGRDMRASHAAFDRRQGVPGRMGASSSSEAASGTQEPTVRQVRDLLGQEVELQVTPSDEEGKSGQALPNGVTSPLPATSVGSTSGYSARTGEVQVTPQSRAPQGAPPAASAAGGSNLIDLFGSPPGPVPQQHQAAPPATDLFGGAQPAVAPAAGGAPPASNPAQSQQVPAPGPPPAAAPFDPFGPGQPFGAATPATSSQPPPQPAQQQPAQPQEPFDPFGAPVPPAAPTPAAQPAQTAQAPSAQGLGTWASFGDDPFGAAPAAAAPAVVAAGAGGVSAPGQAAPAAQAPWTTFGTPQPQNGAQPFGGPPPAPGTFPGPAGAPAGPPSAAGAPGASATAMQSNPQADASSAVTKPSTRNEIPEDFFENTMQIVPVQQNLAYMGGYAMTPQEQQQFEQQQILLQQQQLYGTAALAGAPGMGYGAADPSFGMPGMGAAAPAAPKAKSHKNPFDAEPEEALAAAPLAGGAADFPALGPIGAALPPVQGGLGMPPLGMPGADPFSAAAATAAAAPGGAGSGVPSEQGQFLALPDGAHGAPGAAAGSSFPGVPPQGLSAPQLPDLAAGGFNAGAIFPGAQHPADPFGAAPQQPQPFGIASSSFGQQPAAGMQQYLQHPGMPAPPGPRPSALGPFAQAAGIPQQQPGYQQQPGFPQQQMLPGAPAMPGMPGAPAPNAFGAPLVSQGPADPFANLGFGAALGKPTPGAAAGAGNLLGL